MRRTLATLVCVALVGSTAAAQDSATAKKSPAVAVVISLASTVVPTWIGVSEVLNGSDPTAGAMLIGAGTLLGPATGYWYGDVPGWKGGLILRTAVGAGIALATAAVDYTACSYACGLIVIIGGAIVVVSDIRDIARVGSFVRQANALPPVAIVPTFDPRHRASGIAVRVRF